MQKEEGKQLPRLVYMETTYDTLNTIRALVKASTHLFMSGLATLPKNHLLDLIEPGRCCALVDKKEGLEVADEINSGLRKRSDQQVGIICSSVIYDNLFRQIRRLLREGLVPAQVNDFCCKPHSCC